MGEPTRADWNAELYGYTDRQSQTPTGQFWIEGKNLGETIETIQRWANHTFPQQIINPRRIINHLDGEERKELLDAFDAWEVNRDPSKVALEIADHFMLLAALASALNIDLLECLQAKHLINLDRQWADSGNGYDKHVEESR